MNRVGIPMFLILCFSLHVNAMHSQESYSFEEGRVMSSIMQECKVAEAYAKIKNPTLPETAALEGEELVESLKDAVTAVRETCAAIDAKNQGATVSSSVLEKLAMQKISCLEALSSFYDSVKGKFEIIETQDAEEVRTLLRSLGIIE